MSIQGQCLPEACLPKYCIYSEPQIMKVQCKTVYIWRVLKINQNKIKVKKSNIISSEKALFCNPELF